MDKTIAQLNIAHFREKLKTETDEAKRQTLRRLLAEEEAKLAALNAAPGQKPTAYRPRLRPFPPVYLQLNTRRFPPDLI